MNIIFGVGLGAVVVVLVIVLYLLKRLFDLLQKAIHTEVAFISAKMGAVVDVSVSESKLKEGVDAVNQKHTNGER